MIDNIAIKKPYCSICFNRSPHLYQELIKIMLNKEVKEEINLPKFWVCVNCNEIGHKLCIESEFENIKLLNKNKNTKILFNNNEQNENNDFNYNMIFDLYSCNKCINLKNTELKNTNLKCYSCFNSFGIIKQYEDNQYHVFCKNILENNSITKIKNFNCYFCNKTVKYSFDFCLLNCGTVSHIFCLMENRTDFQTDKRVEFNEDILWNVYYNIKQIMFKFSPFKEISLEDEYFNSFNLKSKTLSKFNQQENIEKMKSKMISYKPIKEVNNFNLKINYKCCSKNSQLIYCYCNLDVNKFLEKWNCEEDEYHNYLQCDLCFNWLHFKCENVKKNNISNYYICIKCDILTKIKNNFQFELLPKLNNYLNIIDFFDLILLNKMYKLNLNNFNFSKNGLLIYDILSPFDKNSLEYINYIVVYENLLNRIYENLKNDNSLNIKKSLNLDYIILEYDMYLNEINIIKKFFIKNQNNKLVSNINLESISFIQKSIKFLLILLKNDFEINSVLKVCKNFELMNIKISQFSNFIIYKNINDLSKDINDLLNVLNKKLEEICLKPNKNIFKENFKALFKYSIIKFENEKSIFNNCKINILNLILKMFNDDNIIISSISDEIKDLIMYHKTNFNKNKKALQTSVKQVSQVDQEFLNEYYKIKDKRNKFFQFCINNINNFYFISDYYPKIEELDNFLENFKNNKDSEKYKKLEIYKQENKQRWSVWKNDLKNLDFLEIIQRINSEKIFFDKEIEGILIFCFIIYSIKNMLDDNLNIFSYFFNIYTNTDIIKLFNNKNFNLLKLDKALIFKDLHNELNYKIDLFKLNLNNVKNNNWLENKEYLKNYKNEGIFNIDYKVYRNLKNKFKTSESYSIIKKNEFSLLKNYINVRYDFFKYIRYYIFTDKIINSLSKIKNHKAINDLIIYYNSDIFNFDQFSEILKLNENEFLTYINFEDFLDEIECQEIFNQAIKKFLKRLSKTSEEIEEVNFDDKKDLNELFFKLLMNYDYFSSLSIQISIENQDNLFKSFDLIKSFKENFKKYKFEKCNKKKIKEIVNKIEDLKLIIDLYNFWNNIDTIDYVEKEEFYNYKKIVSIIKKNIFLNDTKFLFNLSRKYFNIYDIYEILSNVNIFFNEELENNNLNIEVNDLYNFNINNTMKFTKNEEELFTDVRNLSLKFEKLSFITSQFQDSCILLKKMINKFYDLYNKLNEFNLVNIIEKHSVYLFELFENYLFKIVNILNIIGFDNKFRLFLEQDIIILKINYLILNSIFNCKNFSFMCYVQNIINQNDLINKDLIDQFNQKFKPYFDLYKMISNIDKVNLEKIENLFKNNYLSKGYNKWIEFNSFKENIVLEIFDVFCRLKSKSDSTYKWDFLQLENFLIKINDEKYKNIVEEDIKIYFYNIKLQYLWNKSKIEEYQTLDKDLINYLPSRVINKYYINNIKDDKIQEFCNMIEKRKYFFDKIKSLSKKLNENIIKTLLSSEDNMIKFNIIKKIQIENKEYLEKILDELNLMSDNDNINQYKSILIKIIITIFQIYWLLNKKTKFIYMLKIYTKIMDLVNKLSYYSFIEINNIKNDINNVENCPDSMNFIKVLLFVYPLIRMLKNSILQIKLNKDNKKVSDFLELDKNDFDEEYNKSIKEKKLLYENLKKIHEYYSKYKSFFFEKPLKIIDILNLKFRNNDLEYIRFNYETSTKLNIISINDFNENNMNYNNLILKDSLFTDKKIFKAKEKHDINKKSTKEKENNYFIMMDKIKENSNLNIIDNLLIKNFSYDMEKIINRNILIFKDKDIRTKIIYYLKNTNNINKHLNDYNDNNDLNDIPEIASKYKKEDRQINKSESELNLKKSFFIDEMMYNTNKDNNNLKKENNNKIYYFNNNDNYLTIDNEYEDIKLKINWISGDKKWKFKEFPKLGNFNISNDNCFKISEYSNNFNKLRLTHDLDKIFMHGWIQILDDFDKNIYKVMFDKQICFKIKISNNHIIYIINPLTINKDNLNDFNLNIDSFLNVFWYSIQIIDENQRIDTSRNLSFMNEKQITMTKDNIYDLYDKELNFLKENNFNKKQIEISKEDAYNRIKYLLENDLMRKNIYLILLVIEDYNIINDIVSILDYEINLNFFYEEYKVKKGNIYYIIEQIKELNKKDFMSIINKLLLFIEMACVLKD